MKKRILLSAIVVTVVCVLVGGATFAYFTDSATNSWNNFSAGTIDLQAVRDSGEPKPGPMFYFDPQEGRTPSGITGKKPDGFWYPGKTSAPKTLWITNTGSLNAYVDRISASFTDLTNDNIADDQILPKGLILTVRNNGENGQILYQGALDNLRSPVNLQSRVLVEGNDEGTAIFYFTVNMPNDPDGDDNQYQARKIGVTFNIYATQESNNP